MIPTGTGALEAGSAVCGLSQAVRGIPATPDCAGMLRKISARIGSLRCRVMHRNISRPVNGRYICWSCLREFPVEWR